MRKATRRLLILVGALCFLLFNACASETLVGPFDRPDTIRRLFRELSANGLHARPALVMHSSGRASSAILETAAPLLGDDWKRRVSVAEDALNGSPHSSELDAVIRQLPVDILFGISDNQEIAALERTVLHPGSVISFARILEDRMPLVEQRDATIAMLRSHIEVECRAKATQRKPSRVAFFIDVCYTCYSGQELSRAIEYAEKFSLQTCVAIPDDYYTLVRQLAENPSVQLYRFDQNDPILADLLFRYHLLAGHAPLIWSVS